MELLLIPTFAILNRWRGSDWPKSWCAFIAKLIAGAILGLLLPIAWYYSIPLMIGLYLLGESLGWGKWIGTILDREPRYGSEKGIEVWLVHKPANLFISEFRDHIMYSFMALTIRGVIWWIPTQIAFGVLQYPSDWWYMPSSFILYAGFPIAFEIARRFPKYNWFGDSYVENWWKIGEVIYGAFQGLAFYIIVA